jgi:ketosteroid isomerase-like protein
MTTPSGAFFARSGFSSNTILAALAALTLAAMLATSLGAQQNATQAKSLTATEQTIWDLEHSYWRYVQNNDLSAYRSLWHDDFLGWPRMSSEPVRKDHITDWITSQTAKGLTFKPGEFQPAGIRITGNVAMVFYRMTSQWVDKDGVGKPTLSRITHTWIKNGAKWQIIGGMSMPEPETPQQ